mgnify:CR=1 FL=1
MSVNKCFKIDHFVEQLQNLQCINIRKKDVQDIWKQLLQSAIHKRSKEHRKPVFTLNIFAHTSSQFIL